MEAGMAHVFTHFEVDDYDAWKQTFDADPAGRKEAAKGHRLYRSVENPKLVFVATEFGSVEDAKAFRERLLASGALDNASNVVMPPTIVEEADSATY
jgi:hypothetical protein